MKHIAKKWLAGILSVVMVFSLLPVMARAEEDGETPEKTAVERVQELIDALPDAKTITEDNRADVEAQIDAIDGAMAELSEDEAAALDTTRYDAAVAALSALDGQPADPDPEPSAAERVQELIDALPEAETITEDNRADVEARIDAIDGAMAELSEDEAAELDTTRYDAAVAALLALDAPSALEQVQALIDALPDAAEITADNRADVEAQLTAIDEAKQDLTDDELDALDITRYMAAAEAILALDDMAGADVPRTIATENSIKYMDWNSGQKKLGEKTCNTATTVESDTITWSNNTWYVVSKDITISSRITVSGTVHLILMDGYTLTAQKGITVAKGKSLTIYGQTGQSGTLLATGTGGHEAGIGGDWGNSTAGTITINGGNITAYSEESAGIGGASAGGDGGNITINGGNVTATSAAYGAGIGGGGTASGGTITINGGTVTASGGDGKENVAGAGIGGGAGWEVSTAGGAGTIIITGGTVIAKGGSAGGAGIGDGSNNGATGTITITGGTITATGGTNAAGIGKSDTSNGSSSTFSTGANGSAVIHASISDTSNQSSWSGVIFNGNSGKVYGNPTPVENFEVKSGETLTIPNGTSLTVADGVTLTNNGELNIDNNGKIINSGTINVGSRDCMDATLNNEGTITNNNLIDVWGQLTNGEAGINNQNGGKIEYHFKVDVTASNFTSAQYGYSPQAQKITIKNTGELSATITKVEIIGSGMGDFILNPGNNTKLETTGSTNESWTIQPVAGLSVGTHTATISVTYSGDGGVSKTATAEVTFTVTQATPTVNVSVSGTLIYGSEITLTANVTAPNVNNSEITGNVTFKAGTQELGTVTAANGTATLTIQSTDGTKQKALFDNKQVTAEYKGNDNIEGSSGNTSVTVEPKELTFKFEADEKIYDGETGVTGTLSGPTGLVGTDTVESSYVATAENAYVGDNVKVTVNVTIRGDNAKYYTAKDPTGVTVKIVKANIGDGDVTAPVGATNLTYNGTDQGLIQTAGEATGGTMKYYVGEKGVSTKPDGEIEWKGAADIKGKDAGTYTVWYYVEGDGNHNNTEAQSITVEIAQKEVTLEWSGDTELTYTGSAHTISATVNNKEDGDEVNVTVEVKANGGETGVSGATATNAGSYTATATGLTGSAAKNYKLPSDKTKVFTIAKAPVSFTVEDYEVTYDTKTHTATVTQKDSESPKLGDGDFSVTYGDDNASSETNAGGYAIHVKLNNDNFKFDDLPDETREKTLTEKLTIKQAELKLEVSGSDIIYGDTLSKSNLTGTATIKDSKTTISGTWAWDAGADLTYPSVKDNSEKTPYKVIFTPTSGAENFVDTSKSTTITITVKPYTLTPVVVASSVSDKIYDGNTSVADGGTLEFENMELFNSAPFNSTQPTISGTFAFTSEDAGTKTVNVTGIKFDKNGDNYSLSKTTIEGAEVIGSIQQKEVTLTWALDGEDAMTAGYTTTAHTVTATATTGVEGETVNVTVENGTKTNAGTYTAKAAGLTDTETGRAGNYKLPDGVEQEYTITPAEVSFTIENEVKADWASYHETNGDPNPEGYDLTGEGTDYALTMTYDSFYHAAEVKQTAGEAVTIEKKTENGYSVTYKRVKDAEGKDVTEAAIEAVRNAGTYEIWVTINPVSSSEDVWNYVFSGHEDETSLKIGTITVNPYEITVAWTHLSYVYHGHPMHPNITVLNAFKNDLYTGTSLPTDFDPDTYKGNRVIAFGATEGSDVGEYTVTAKLYGANAGNYTVDDNTETVTIVPAPVTFTVGDNVWVIGEGGALSRNTVTLRPAWGAVSTTPDVAVHHSYPLAGTKLDVDTLNVTIEYWQNGEKVEAPREAGKYEVWVKIGNENYRHSATETGELHHVGELVITDDPNSIRTYTVTFDPGYEGAPKGPAAIERAFPNQTVVLPPVSGENGDRTTYDMTRTGYSFLGWSYNGHTYQPNEELHMPAADVTFKGEWIEAVPIGGRVVQESSGGEPTPVNGATVVLKQGSEPTAEAVTGSDGSFDFGLVTPGIYNLEVTYENGGGAKIVKTFLIEVGDSGSVDNEFVLPDAALNTVVEVAPGIKSAVSMDGMITDEAAADVYTESDKKTVENGGTVEFKMSISEATLTDDQEEEIPVPEERISMVLDMKLTKTVTENGGASPTLVQIHDSKIPVTTVIHLPAEIQGKSGYTVYRFHDEDGDGNKEMRAITTSKNENGEYLQVVREGTAIELHAEFYSTYVLTWYQSSGSGATAYPVTLPENALNGTVTANYEKAVKNSVVTLTVTPDEGHVLGELTVTDSDGNAIALTDNGDGTYSFVMPDGGVTVKAVFNCEGGENCQSRKFTDLDVKAWYHDYTDYVIGCGLMHGVGGKLFDPNGAVTRAQMVTVLWNMSGDPVVNYYMTYSDVSESAWYAEAIRWATSEGVVDGYGNGKFGPNDVITREQMATMLYRYEQKYGDGGFTGEWMYRLPFTDLDQISDWAFEAVAWCNMKGIITGKDGNRVDPKGSAKRCEMAAVLTRYCAENDTENDTE